MQRFQFSIIACRLIIVALFAVSAVPCCAQTGGERQIMDSNDLYYNIVDYRLPGVEVTYPNRHQADLWRGHEMPKGDVTFPETIVYEGIRYDVFEVAPWTFEGCEGVRSVTLTDHVRMVGFSAFALCTALRRMDLPQSVEYLGGCAFFGCHSLQEVTLPDSLREIRPYTFADCAALGRIALPKALRTVGARAFSGCAALEEVRVQCVVPPVAAADAFEGIAAGAMLYVPRGARGAYAEAAGWNLFPHIEEF